MASIQTAIELNDQFTSVIYGIISAVNVAVGTMKDMQSTMNANVDSRAFEGIHDDLTRATIAMDQFQNQMEVAAQQQNHFNQRMSEGVSHSNHLLQKVTGIVGAYATLHTMGNIIGLSDTMTQTNARLSLIVDDGGSVEELQNKIYASAQNARGSYLTTADAVSKLGMQASQAFSSNDELIGFTELLNKSFVNAGTSAQGIDSVMLQLTQSMAAGKLQGEELNAVLDNAAPIVQNIQQYLEEVQGIDASNIKELASEGVITADVIKNSMFYAADEINAKFESMPMTWGQIWSQIKNDAVDAFEPVLQRINDLANSEKFQAFVNQVSRNMQTLANIVLYVFDLMGEAGNFVEDNWSIISPIVYGVVAAMAAYVAVSTIVAVINGIMATAAAVHAAAEMMQAGATFAATVAQHGLNAALLACPLTWIILLIIALIAIIFAVCSAIAKLTGVADSGFGVIAGGVNVVIQFFKNFGLTVANIALGIGNAIAALGSNMMTAFHNAICSVQAWWYDLLSTCLSVIENICVALNKLPFVEFDYSGISSAADEYAAKAIEVDGNKDDYQNIGEAFSNGFNTFDTFQNGWVSDAFEAGASWGDGVSEAVSNFSFSDLLGGRDKLDEKVPRQDDFLSGFQDTIGDNIGSIAGDTGAIKDSMDITEEELKYLRDAAEQEAVNRFTAAEISVDMSGMRNTVNSGDDLDGFMSMLTDSVNEAVDSMTEGVHE